MDKKVAPVDECAADTLARTLHGKGAFHRFKVISYYIDERWLKAWYKWRDEKLNATVEEWLKSI